MADVKHDLGLKAVKALNIALVTASFAACWYLYYAPRIYSPFFKRGNWAVIALFAVIYITYCGVYDALVISINRASEVVYSQILAAGITDLILYVVTFLLTKHIPHPVPLLLTFFCQAVLAGVWTMAARAWYFVVFPPKKTAVIYDHRPGLETVVSEYGLRKKFDIQVTASVAEYLQNPGIIDGMEVAFLSGIRSHERNIILKRCIRDGIEIYVIPRIGDTIMSGAKQMHMLHLPILNVCWQNPPAEYLIAKRTMDIVIAGLALAVAFPFMLVTAVAIKACDGGPVLYKQKRLTKDRKEFEVLKFRSMRVDAEKDGVARLSAGDNDDRITPVGRVIRKCRIDELPQLFNVLGGSMSLVGPRPERPEIAAQYMEELPEFELRLKGKAGLTGYAQVYGKYNTEPYDKLQMDLMYLAHPSIVEDLRIMFTTVKVLFLPESTEGVAAGQVTAEAAAGTGPEGQESGTGRMTEIAAGTAVGWETGIKGTAGIVAETAVGRESEIRETVDVVAGTMAGTGLVTMTETGVGMTTETACPAVDDNPEIMGGYRDRKSVGNRTTGKLVRIQTFQAVVLRGSPRKVEAA